jgi:hypothetical protein
MSRVPIFDRVYARAHPYEAILKAIFDDKDSPEDRAVARNLSYDHRVPPRRQQRLSQCVTHLIDKRRARLGDDGGAPPSRAPARGRLTRQDLADAVTKYFKDYIRYQQTPDFSSRELNGKNILKFPGQSRRKGMPHDSDLLVNVFDLNGLMPVYLKAASQIGTGNYSDWYSTFADIESTAARLDEWLDKKLDFDPDASAKPLVATDAQKEFVKTVLKALNIDRTGWPGEQAKPNPYQPTWAAKWDEFLVGTGWTPYGLGDPRSWVEVTGVAKKTTGRWLILLVYPVQKVPILARPTILDAGWSDRHFPSPPCAPLDVGGHPIDLGKNYLAGGPISEFIHPQIDIDLTYWENSGYALGRTAGVVGRDVQGEREAHQMRLRNQYKDTWRDDWMSDPC